MKDKDKSCKKGKESTIGKIIYGFLLFMPLLAIGTTCLYAIFNKNAYKSWKDNQEETIININQNTILTEGVTYQINYTTGYTQGQTFYISNGQTNIVNLYFPGENWTAVWFIPTTETSRTRLIVYDTNNNQHNKFNWQEEHSSFYFVSNGQNSVNTNNNYAYTITTITYTNGTIDNAFFYSIQKTEQSNLFNWVENNAIYTGIQNTCETLSITNTFIPLLLTYWLIISVLYFLYDIILMILHMLHRKIHELQDSI